MENMPKISRLTYEDADQRLRFCNSYTRLDTLMELRYEMRSGTWLKLLGEYWSVCDNIAVHLFDLAEIFLGYEPVKQMMTSAEWRQYESLPDAVTIFRGCSPNNLVDRKSVV